jgi:hypothetical protein
MLDLQTKQSKVRPTAGDIKSNPFPFCFCKVLSPILAMLLLASSAWAFETDEDSQVGTSEKPKKFLVFDKVGINKPNPNKNLDVDGDGKFSGEVEARKFIGEVDGTWNTNGSSINYSNGNVGIGTAWPSQLLEVNGTVKASQFEGGGIYWKKIPDSSNQGIYFDNGNVKRVGIGTNFPKERLHVFGDIRLGQGTPSEGTINRMIHVRDYNTVHIGRNRSNLDGRFMLTVGGDINVEGDYYRNGSSIIKGRDEDSSDRRLKKNIKPIADVLPKLQQIDGVYFDWKQPKHDSQKRRQIGVIAQAVEAQFPELVTTGGDGYKSVAYSNIVAVLIQAVKELKRDNDALAERIRALEEEVE